MHKLTTFNKHIAKHKGSEKVHERWHSSQPRDKTGECDTFITLHLGDNASEETLQVRPPVQQYLAYHPF